ncbi:MAG TPA: NUDIX domain-containing protein [Patescibacteria group bacterium]
MHLYKEYTLPYTICFGIIGKKVLLIKRKKEPYLGKWNGLGGKIEENENPDDAAIREMIEETGFESLDGSMEFRGIVTWGVLNNNKKQGMYAYFFNYPEKLLFNQKDTREGLLEWKNLDWILGKNNEEVAKNLKYFLPEMLNQKKPMHYQFEYSNPRDKSELTKFTVSELE